MSAAAEALCSHAGQAAIITWDTRSISGDGNVLDTGNLVLAYNVNGPSTTVNGVTFSPLSHDAGAGSASAPGLNLDGSAYDKPQDSAQAPFTPPLAAWSPPLNRGSPVGRRGGFPIDVMGHWSRPPGCSDQAPRRPETHSTD